ncbi:MAG: hypothetical protein KGH94_01795 [Candidatus Micrarchaeota archaeon]|nr:hypothetical protein [Candidatus Micrarchaeota archaeon]
MVGMDSKKKRYQEEIKRIRQLSALNKVLKKGDVENAFLNNADKETEISKDTAVERMLDELESDKSSKRDLAVLDSLVGEETGSRSSSRSRTQRRAKPQRRSMPRRAAKPKSGRQSRRKR